MAGERDEAARPPKGPRITDSLSIVYKDSDLVVYTAPSEEELKIIVLDLLRRYGRMSVREIHRHLSGLASEDKIRSALSYLASRNLVFADRDGYFYPA